MKINQRRVVGHTHQLSKSVCIVFAFIGMMMASIQVYANDAKSINGLGCSMQTVAGVSKPYNADSGIKHKNTYAYSPGTWVVCPLLKDTKNPRDSLSWAMVWIKQQFTNRSSSCRFFTSDEWGNTVRNEAILDFKGTGKMVFEFHNQAESAINGNYTLLCYLAPQAEIVNIMWMERPATDID